MVPTVWRGYEYLVNYTQMYPVVLTDGSSILTHMT